MNKPDYSRWSDEQIKELKQLLATGRSYSKIGKHFGVSRNAISGIVFRLNLTVPKEPSAPRSYEARNA